MRRWKWEVRLENNRKRTSLESFHSPSIEKILLTSSSTASLVSVFYLLAVQASCSSLKGFQKFLACIGCDPWIKMPVGVFCYACRLFKGRKGLDSLRLRYVVE
jgi:hypothetical protein